VLDSDPDNAEAMYGYGYILLSEGKTDSAKTWLCKALSSDNVDTQREVRGVLDTKKLACR
jgi:Tfp pilus assembly protein PilF